MWACLSFNTQRFYSSLISGNIRLVQTSRYLQGSLKTGSALNNRGGVENGISALLGPSAIRSKLLYDNMQSRISLSQTQKL